MGNVAEKRAVIDIEALRAKGGDSPVVRVFSDFERAVATEALQNFECDYRNGLFDEEPNKAKLTKADFSFIEKDEAALYFKEARLILRAEGEGYDPVFTDHIKVIYNKRRAKEGA